MLLNNWEGGIYSHNAFVTKPSQPYLPKNSKNPLGTINETVILFITFVSSSKLYVIIASNVINQITKETPF